MLRFYRSCTGRNADRFRPCEAVANRPGHFLGPQCHWTRDAYLSAGNLNLALRYCAVEEWNPGRQGSSSTVTYRYAILYGII